MAIRDFGKFRPASQLPLFGEGFVTSGDDSTLAQNDGYLWLSTPLGTPLLIPAYGSITVQITGIDEHGDVRSGTGLTLVPWHVLTSAHVTQDTAETTFRESCFLYSAVTRPGNSGGPIVAGDGRVIGIVAHDTFDKARGEQARFFRGIPANKVVGALADLGFAHLTTLEDWS